MKKNSDWTHLRDAVVYTSIPLTVALVWLNVYSIEWLCPQTSHFQFGFTFTATVLWLSWIGFAVAQWFYLLEEKFGD